MSRVFVCGATGTQGGVIARRLLSHGIPVSFMTRDPSGTQAKALIALGATLCPGTYDEPSAIASALQGCTALFLNFMPSFTDFAEETRHATAITDAALAHGIKHAVYSSSLGIDEIPGLPFWDPNSIAAVFFNAKRTIADMVKDKFEAWSIIRPAKFMSDFLSPRAGMLFPGFAETGVWTSALRPADSVALVDVETIGVFGAAALMEPERFKGREVDVFDQMVKPKDLVAALSKAAGRDLTVEFLPDAEIRERQLKGDVFLTAQQLMRDADTYADIEKVKIWGLPLNTWDQFLEREKERVVETYRATA
jgi:uncharacterized protein YbjT (DUF2867 family)